ncbi:hypothetical protein [Pseudomonas antarctica]|uniref:hypothetical protein n=1 Tax=Pseudomonas antarctica TaxID=219572 RepID=UPI00387AD065
MLTTDKGALWAFLTQRIFSNNLGSDTGCLRQVIEQRMAKSIFAFLGHADSHENKAWNPKAWNRGSQTHSQK